MVRSVVRILGIVAKTHDSGIALLSDGMPEFVLEEERYNRSKKTKKFPKFSLAAAFAELRHSGSSTSTSSPRRGTCGACAGRCLAIVARRFPLSLSLLLPSIARVAAEPDHAAESAISRRGLRKTLSVSKLPPIVNVGHHDSHAAVFFVSPFEEALVLVMDGYGDDSSSSAYTGPWQPAGAALVDRHHELGRPGLHLRHRVPGLRRLRRRRQGDGAGRVRRATPTSSASATSSGRRRRRLCRQYGLFQLRQLRPAAAVPAQVHRHLRAARERRTSRSPTGTAIWPSRCRPSPKRWSCIWCARC